MLMYFHAEVNFQTKRWCDIYNYNKLGRQAIWTRLTLVTIARFCFCLVLLRPLLCFFGGCRSSSDSEVSPEESVFLLLPPPVLPPPTLLDFCLAGDFRDF